MYKHGYAGTPTYNVWVSMKKRCFNKNADNYKNYGGRGITVCIRWLKFENFIKDMGEQPVGLQLNRKNNNKGYCKSNCNWVTPKKNSNNTRNTHRVKIGINVKSISEWADIAGLDKDTVWRRVVKYGRKGKSILKPLRYRRITIGKMTMTLMEWSKKTGINYYVLHQRLRMGWKGEQMLKPVRRKKK